MWEIGLWNDVFSKPSHMPWKIIVWVESRMSSTNNQIILLRNLIQQTL